MRFCFVIPLIFVLGSCSDPTGPNEDLYPISGTLEPAGRYAGADVTVYGHAMTSLATVSVQTMLGSAKADAVGYFRFVSSAPSAEHLRKGFMEQTGSQRTYGDPNANTWAGILVISADSTNFLWCSDSANAVHRYGLLLVYSDRQTTVNGRDSVPGLSTVVEYQCSFSKGWNAVRSVPAESSAPNHVIFTTIPFENLHWFTSAEP